MIEGKEKENWIRKDQLLLLLTWMMRIMICHFHFHFHLHFPLHYHDAKIDDDEKEI